LNCVTSPAAWQVEPLELVLLDQEHVADARRGQVIGHAAAGDAAADHDHVCPLRLHRR